MSKTTAKKRHRKKPGTPPAPRTRDRSIYLGLFIIGAAVALFAYLVFEGQPYWRHITLGYVIAMAWLMNVYAVSAYRGKHLANWQQALARIPLRFAGYGTKHGKPLEAAHGSVAARRAIIMSVVVSAAIVVLVSFVLLWDELKTSII
ncbi:MAG: hypothetical protein GY715_17805 [Planctomycetes bacterium]|nr:hypothetical protein [Planctomycetota bacterium]